MARDSKELDETKRLMAALGRMPPKPHEDMRLGKRVTPKRPESQRKKTKAAKRGA